MGFSKWLKTAGKEAHFTKSGRDGSLYTLPTGLLHCTPYIRHPDMKTDESAWRMLMTDRTPRPGMVTEPMRPEFSSNTKIRTSRNRALPRQIGPELFPLAAPCRTLRR